MPIRSEYLGIRVAMHDALQRYYSQYPMPESDEEKVLSICLLIKISCSENSLLGERADVIGDAWAEFINSRDPAKVVAFLGDGEVINHAVGTPLLKSKVSNFGLWDISRTLTSARNFAFEEIAQRTGLINYVAGETLSGHIREAEQRLGHTAPHPQAETGAIRRFIKRVFDSPYGEVKPEDISSAPSSFLDSIRKGRAGRERE